MKIDTLFGWISEKDYTMLLNVITKSQLKDKVKNITIQKENSVLVHTVDGYTFEATYNAENMKWYFVLSINTY